MLPSVLDVRARLDSTTRRSRSRHSFKQWRSGYSSLMDNVAAGFPWRGEGGNRGARLREELRREERGCGSKTRRGGQGVRTQSPKNRRGPVSTALLCCVGGCVNPTPT